MFQLGKKIEAFANKAPVAVLVRTVLQRDLDPERMDRLFHDTAELQYENKLECHCIIKWSFYCIAGLTRRVEYGKNTAF